jgi:hypothetical protein
MVEDLEVRVASEEAQIAGHRLFRELKAHLEGPIYAVEHQNSDQKNASL